MTERSDQNNGSRRFPRRLARKQLAALAAIGLVLLLAAAAALAVTGAGATDGEGYDGAKRPGQRSAQVP